MMLRWSAWARGGGWLTLSCGFLLAQTPPQAESPQQLLERVEAFVATPIAATAEARKRAGAACQSLVRKLSTAELPETERLARLQRLHGVAKTLDGTTEALAALAVAISAFALDDHDQAIAAAQEAAAVQGNGELVKGIRVQGLRFLFQMALRKGDVERAFPYLTRYAEAADPLAAGLAECDLLLQVGMVRSAAVVLDRLEAEVAEPAQRHRVACRRLQELLANEQYEAARAGAVALLAEPGLPATLADQVQLTRLFAEIRLGGEAAAESGLRAALASPSLRPEHATLARAELAMLRLQRGDPVAAAAAELGPDLGARLESLPEWSVAARARLLLADPNAEAGPLAAIHAALLARHRFLMRQWRATPVLSDGVAFLQWSVRRELLVCLCEVEMRGATDGAGMRCLRYLLEADACGSLARRLGIAVGEPAALLANGRDPSGLLLWFLPAPRGSLVFVVDADGVRALPLPGDVPLRALVRSLREGVRDETVLGRNWQVALAERIAPLVAWAFPADLRAALAGNARVTILGRELLTGLPFELLPSPSEPSRWFGHTHAIDYLPSATLAAAAGPAAVGNQSGRLAILAATRQSPTSASRYPDCAVPVDRDRLVAIAAALAPDAVELELEPTRENLGRVAAAVDALVVLAHGRRRHPDDAVGELQRHSQLGIVLGDGFLGAEHLLPPQRTPPLVVLASCGTARAGVDRGEDGQLFGTAWLAAGSRAVLSAESDLELRATERLLAAFLASLAAGASPAEALRQARIEVAAEPGLAHPAFHCTLRLDAAGPVVVQLSRAPRLWWPWLGLGGVLATCLCGIAVRRRAVRSD